MNSLKKDEILSLWNMVFNLSIHMLHSIERAEDETQMIFEKVLTRYKDFREESSLKTWVYSIAKNHLIDIQRKIKREEISFELFEKDAQTYTPYNGELSLNSVEEKLYVEEVKVGCTLAILQCLEPESRFIFILGSIFNFSHREAAEICNLGYDNFRKKLSRINNRIRSFMGKNCGLINPDAKCQCRKRLLIAVKRGRINPEKMLYINEDRKINQMIDVMNEIDLIAQTFQGNPFMISHRLKEFKVLWES